MSPTGPSSTLVRRIEWSDTDAAGHQHNTAVLRFVEACEAQLFRELGCVELYFGAAPRVRHEIDYLGKLYFGQQVTTTVSVEKVGRSSLTFTFDMWGEAFAAHPRRQVAQGRFVTVYVPHGTEQAQPWPAQIRDAVTGGAGPDRAPG